MKTEALIALLSEHSLPVPRRAAGRRVALALALALPMSVALMLSCYGLRTDLEQAAQAPMFWLKVSFPLVIGIAALAVVQRLGRPGVRLGAWQRIGLVAPVLLVWTIGLWQWLAMRGVERPEMLLGHTWRSCAFNIVAIGAPVLVAAMIALRGLAPTQPARAGAAAGALAGAAGAAVYAWHCPEMGAPFLAVWYIGGIVLSTLLGALLGPKWLRW